MGGSPWQYRDRYIENSPFFYLDRVSTPLLLIHGGDDHPALAEQTFSALRRLSKRVEYARYEGEGHHQMTWSLEDQADYWGRILRWYDRYLLPKSAGE
jgi:dipeptidyl aminopeptidase/acylaminoacyl peptidase